MTPPPYEVEVLNIFGAEYFIRWADVTRGASFFIPTTATPKQVQQALRPAAEWFGHTFEVRSRCEFGVYGVRVWRTS
jgi:hypothetical protein